MRRREVPSEAKEQIAKEAGAAETEGTPEIDPAALAEAVEKQVAMEQYARDRMAEQLGPQQEAVRGLLNELDVDPEGKTPREVGDEVEKKVSGFMTKLGGAGRGKFGKTVKTLVLAAMVLGVAAGVATAGETGGGYELEGEDEPEEDEDEEGSVPETGEEIASSEEAEAEPADLDVETVKTVIREYIPQVGEIDGLTQAEGETILSAMIKAGIASAETHGQETIFRANCDQMIEYAKYLMENEDNPDLRVKGLQYGLEKMVNDISFRVVDQTEGDVETPTSSELETNVEAATAAENIKELMGSQEDLANQDPFDEMDLWGDFDKEYAQADPEQKDELRKVMAEYHFREAMSKILKAGGESEKFQEGKWTSTVGGWKMVYEVENGTVRGDISPLTGGDQEASEFEFSVPEFK